MSDVRYEPDHKGIEEFLHGPELDKAVEEACVDIIGLATGHSEHLDEAGWHNNQGPPMVIGDYSRLTREVVNEAPLAASIEFGTGLGRPGRTDVRPQGGYSHPQRILAKAGEAIGDHHEG